MTNNNNVGGQPDAGPYVGTANPEKFRTKAAYYMQLAKETPA